MKIANFRNVAYLAVMCVTPVILALGFTDDMAILMGAIGLVRSHITQAHRDRAKAALDEIRTPPVAAG